MALHRKPLSPWRIRLRGAVWGSGLGVFLMAGLLWVVLRYLGQPIAGTSDPFEVWVQVMLISGIAFGPGFLLLGLLLTRILQSIAARTTHGHQVLLSGVILGAPLGFAHLIGFLVLVSYLSGKMCVFEADSVVMALSGLTAGNVFGMGCALAVRPAGEGRAGP